MKLKLKTAKNYFKNIIRINIFNKNILRNIEKKYEMKKDS